MTVPSVEWPLIGRDDVVAELDRILSGNGRCVVVAGSPGVGKTRLATEALIAAGRRGQATLRISANSGLAKLPLGAFAPFLPPMDQVDLTKPQTLQQVSRAVIGRARGKALTVLVDDAHLIDDVSAAVIAQLLTARKVSIIVTVRTKAHTPDAIVNLWKDGVARRVDLAPLSEADIEQLVSAALKGDVDSTTLRWLASHTEGNPLYLRELVLGALAAGALEYSDGLWRLRGSLYSDQLLETILSDRIVELVEMRQSKLTRLERDALRIVAIGEPLSLTMLESVVGFEPLRSLEIHGMLSVGNGRVPEVRLAHPIYGDVIRARTPPIAFREIHRSLAEALEASGSDSPADLLRIASWRLEGGGEVRPDLMFAAAKYANASGDPRLAERLARAAVDAGAGFGAKLLLGQLAWRLGRGSDAAHLLGQLPEEATTDEQRAAAASTLMDVLGFGLGRTSEAARIGLEAEAAIGSVEARDELVAKRAQILLQVGETGHAWDLIEPIIDRARGGTLASAAVTGSTCLTLMGRLGDAARLNDRGATAHADLGDRQSTFGPYVHVVLRAMIMVRSGQLAEAETLLRSATRTALLDEDQEAIGAYSVELAHVSLVRGRPQTASRYAREALSVLADQDALAFVGVAQLLLVQATALLRPAELSKEACARLVPIDEANSVVFGADVLRAHAWVSVAAGDISSAAALFKRAVSRARVNGEHILEIFARHDYARVTGTVAEVDRLRWLVDQVESPLTQVMLSHIVALEDGDPRALEAVADEFEQLGADVLAAETVCTAAVLQTRQHGQRRRVAALQRRASAIRRRCEDASTPALSTVQSQAILARREFEVAQLAANGWTNRTMAEHFGVSTRTIENQLQRVYEKLGIGQRSELADALIAESAEALI